MRLVFTPLALLVGYLVLVVLVSAFPLRPEGAALLLGAVWVAGALFAVSLGSSHAAAGLDHVAAVPAALAGAVAPLVVTPFLPLALGETADRYPATVVAVLAIWLAALVVAAAATSLARGRLGLRAGTVVAVLAGLVIVTMTPYLTVVLHPSVDNPALLSMPLWALVAATGVSGVAPELVNRHDAIYVASGAAVAPMLATSYVLAYVMRGRPMAQDTHLSPLGSGPGRGRGPVDSG